MKPNLCPKCIHCLQGGGLVRARGYTHICHAKGHILSAITTEKGRCPDYEPSEDQRIPQSEIDSQIVELRDFKAGKASRNDR